MKPTEKELTDLWNIVEKFVDEQQISCPDNIFQCDWIIENAYEFIEKCCDVVGYYDCSIDEGEII